MEEEEVMLPECWIDKWDGIEVEEEKKVGDER